MWQYIWCWDRSLLFLELRFSSVAASFLIYNTGLMPYDKKTAKCSFKQVLRWVRVRVIGIFLFNYLKSSDVSVMFCLMINWCHGVRLELTWLQKETTCNLMRYRYCAYWFATERKCLHIWEIVWVCLGVKCCVCNILIFTTEKLIYLNNSWMLNTECIDNKTELSLFNSANLLLCRWTCKYTCTWFV